MAFRNDIFVAYLKEAVGAEAASVVLSALDEPPSVSVRVNPFKKRPDFPGAGQPVPWSDCGFMLGSRPVFTLDPYFSAGCYYVQDSSSMFVGHVLRQVIGGGCPGVEAAGNAVPVGRPCAGRPAIRVLDLCAAPGGKTTDAAASLRAVYGDSFFLVSNEVIRARASVLATNVAVWGDPNVAVTPHCPGFSISYWPMCRVPAKECFGRILMLLSNGRLKMWRIVRQGRDGYWPTCGRHWLKTAF